MSDALFVSLHTKEPGELGQINPTDGDQILNEVQYREYSRVAIGKVNGVWTSYNIGGSSRAQFAYMTLDEGTILARFFGIGLSPSGVGKLVFAGEVFPSISISKGVSACISCNWAMLDTLLLYDGLTKAQCSTRWKINREYVERGMSPPYVLTLRQINCGKSSFLAEIRKER